MLLTLHKSAVNPSPTMQMKTQTFYKKKFWKAGWFLLAVGYHM